MEQQYRLTSESLNNQLKLSDSIRKKELNSNQIKEVALAISAFHRDAKVMKGVFNVTGFQKQFEEINRCIGFTEEFLGFAKRDGIVESLKFSAKFLNKYRIFIQERTITGYMRNGHGNITASNILMKHPPVIKICKKEKSASQMDVLLDLSRLGVDLDYYNIHDLEYKLLNTYTKDFVEKNPEKAQDLYTYYKMFQVNKILKKRIDAITKLSITKEWKLHTDRYFELLSQYMVKLRDKVDFDITKKVLKSNT